MSLDLCLKQLHVVYINVFDRIQYIRLVLFYSVIIQSVSFQSCRFQSSLEDTSAQLSDNRRGLRHRLFFVVTFTPICPDTLRSRVEEIQSHNRPTRLSV